MPHEKDTKLLRRETLIPALLVLLALGVLIYTLSTLSVPAQATPAASTPQYAAKTTGTAGTEDVEIMLEPKGYASGQLVFDYSANTHGVSLSEHDLMQQATLTADGKTYAPTSAPRMGGHHVNGQLVFNLDDKPEAFSVTINGVPAVDEREYSW